MITAELAVEFIGVGKAFGTFVANHDLYFSVKTGSLHALVGENGAGKSTAMNILFGLIPCTKGNIRVFGKAHAPKTPLDAIAQGICMVHQHFMLNPQESALQNFIMSQEAIHYKNALGALTPLGKKTALYRQQLNDLSLDYFGIGFESDRIVQSLSMGERQRLEILKALALNCKVLILDEPTAVLSPMETTQLYQQIKTLTQQKNLSIVLITHKLKDVCSYADAATVLRKGSVVGHFTAPEMTVDLLARSMAGTFAETVAENKPTETKEVTVENSNKPCDADNVIFRVEQLCVKNNQSKIVLNPLNLTVNSGEIIGIAGVEGNGQSELTWALIDPMRLQELGCKISGNFITKPHPSKTAFIPEDRHNDAICVDLAASENLIIGRETLFSRHLLMLKDKVTDNAQKLFEDFDVRPRKIENTLKSFSGGNQQKIVIARELSKNPTWVVAAHPTRGVDLTASTLLQRKLRKVATDGGAVLLISSDLDELIATCDRIFVLFDGTLLGPFLAPFSEAKIGRAMGGIEP